MMRWEIEMRTPSLMAILMHWERVMRWERGMRLEKETRMLS
jgi:hypothetical protein